MTRQVLGGEKVRAAQRCDPTDEMRGTSDLPDTLLESETVKGDRGREEDIVGGPGVTLSNSSLAHGNRGQGKKSMGAECKAE